MQNTSAFANSRSIVKYYVEEYNYLLLTNKYVY